jgi:type IV pilus assembly protein PilQ
VFRTVSPICTAGVAVSLVCASGLDLAPALAQVQGAPTGPAQASPRTIPISARTAPLELRLDRRSDAVDVVISGVGAGPQLQQSNSGAVWLGRLYVATPTGLRRGTQTLSLPEAGFQSISLSGVGNQFNIQVAPVPGFPLGRPLVSADGNNLILTFAAAPQASQQTFSRDLTIPGRVPQPDMVPPLQPRAVAPPVGDMAVGSILIANSGFVNVSGPPITMTMQNAPARTVLMSLSRMGGYGFVYVNGDSSSQAASGSSGTQSAAGSSGTQSAANDQDPSRLISISFRNENYARALNSVLMAAGLQGKVEGNTLLAGPNVLGKGFGAQLSKVYRLNQVGAKSAADYLGTLGAFVLTVNTTTSFSYAPTSSSQSSSNSAYNSNSNQSSSQSSNQSNYTSYQESGKSSQIDSYGASSGPLQGLRVTTDSRLSTITLVGSPALVAVAETYLRQLDLRQRQVALSVKILDVSLDNQKEIDNSFAFRYGNNFIVNDSGQMLGAFGSLLPPTADAFGRGYPQELDFEIGLDGSITAKAPPGYNIMGGANRGPAFYPPGNSASIFKDATRRNPGLAYPPDNFYNFVKAKIESSSTKVLASPTLILSENSEELRTGDDQLAVNIQSLSGGSAGGGGSASAAIGRTKANESYVTVGEQVITNYTVTTGTQGNGNSCQPQFGIAGLTFGARVSKIDDNGFVTFSMSPAISATVRQFPVQGCGPIDILAIRRLDTGSARVRDGQTLILTGVISDRDTEAVTKWPILGDMPIIGQFFRNSGSNRAKRELVILVTPRIIDDTQGGSWGYGYQPSTRDARRFMGTSAGQSPY